MSFGDAFSNRWDVVNGKRGMWYCGRFYTEDEIAAIWLAKQQEEAEYEQMYAPSGVGVLGLLAEAAFALLEVLGRGISAAWAAWQRSRTPAALPDELARKFGGGRRIGFRPPGEEGGD
ncbi:MAG: hypothetical protein H5T97_13435 [Firmicutes bacterium]|nr:hypothetical protein [Bacillota bacterium]